MDRLIGYDNEAAKRMQVLDLETDFYAEKHNPWATEKERSVAAQHDTEIARNKAYGHREKMIATQVFTQTQTKDWLRGSHVVELLPLFVFKRNVQLTMILYLSLFVIQEM